MAASKQEGRSADKDDGCSQMISIKYTVKNELVEDRAFEATLEMKTRRRPFVEIMDEAAALDARFRYKSKYFENLGQYIEEVNGLREDKTRGFFWAFLSLAAGRVLLPVGVSTYVPSEGEHIALAYNRYEASTCNQ